MTNFNGSFKSIWKPYKDNFMRIDNYIVMSAPNRYRKLISDKGPNNNNPILNSAMNCEYCNDTVIEMQIKEFSIEHKPIGLQFDLFDTYIAWEIINTHDN